MLACSALRTAFVVSRQTTRKAARPTAAWAGPIRCRGFADDAVATTNETKTAITGIRKGLRNTEVVNTSGIPEAHQTRTVKIYQPARQTMQQGREKNKWFLEYDRAGTVQGKWTNPLMGWTSTSDPLSNLQMSFKNPEAAIEFCVRNGLAYEVVYPKQFKRQMKNYGAPKVVPRDWHTRIWPYARSAGIAGSLFCVGPTGDNFRYWGRVVDHKYKADPKKIFG